MKKALATIAISVGILLGALLIYLSIYALSGTIAFTPEFTSNGEKSFSVPIVTGILGVLFMVPMSFLGIKKRFLTTNILFVIIGCFMLFWQLNNIIFLQVDIKTASPAVLSFIARQRSAIMSAYPDIYPELVNEYKRFFLGFFIPTALLGAGLLTSGILGILRRLHQNKTSPITIPSPKIS